MLTRPLLSLIVIASILAAAEVEEPDGFWPLPKPSWMLEATFKPSVEITEVASSLPAQAVGLRPGHTIVSTGGMFTASSVEFGLVVRIAAARADNRGEVIRGAGIEALRMPAFTAWGRWGMATRDRVPEMPTGLTPSRQRAWTELPTRVKLAVHALRGAATDQTWLATLLDLRLAADGSTPVPAAVAMPGAYLQRVADWWRLSAVAGGRPGMTDDAAEALFRVLHPNWLVSELPATGTLATGDAAADRLLAGLADRKDDGATERETAAQRVAAGGLTCSDPQLGLYLGQCLGAILDPEGHGGWPYYRTWLIREKPARAKMVAALAGFAKDPALAQIVAFARIGPAIVDADKDALLDSLATLHATSPMLALQGLQCAFRASRFLNNYQFLERCLQEPVLTPAIVARVRLMASRDNHTVDQFLVQTPDPAPLLPMAWSSHLAWRDGMNTGRELGMALNNMLWDLATNPTALDAEHAVSVARQLVMANAEGVPDPHGDGIPYAHADTVAAAMARGGHMSDAISWQQASLTLLHWHDGHGHNRREAQIPALDQEFRARLAGYHRGEVATIGEPKAGTSTTIKLADGLVKSGLTVAGQPAGVWKTSTPEGKIVEELGQMAGQPCGIWLRRGLDGTLRWSGWVNKGSRLGWWRIRTADGGLATGWYDGHEGGGRRCGIWRIYGQDGKLRSEGPCIDDAVAKPWSACDDTGKWRPVEISTITLPAHPPLPDTADRKVAAPVVETPRPSDF
jgi:hypothetical protein